jgi:hypothetical protein
MQVAIDFQDERLDLDIPEGRLVAGWHAAAGVEAAAVRALVHEALEAPRHYPPLRQAVVPGDRVVVALDNGVPQPGQVVAAVCETLIDAGVDAPSITVLTPSPSPLPTDERRSERDVVWAIHDPDDRNGLAYLASTTEGRRVYLNRLLTDADVVVPVGRLGYDPVLGYRGPWSVLFPGLSDRATARALGAGPGIDWPDRDRPPAAFDESAEVSWLLGCQFHLGLLVGARGPLEAVAGLDTVVRDAGLRRLDETWTFEAPARAELVVIGIGQPGQKATFEHLADGLANAHRLVERGGKIVALSRAGGPVGPAFRRLIELDDPRQGLAALRGHEDDPDIVAARRLAGALAWADIYLLSAFDAELIGESPIVPLEHPEQVRRLVAASRSCLVLSQADSARARVASEPPHD